uniref:Uncharacterized protein n=1 Tax=blood disease bacterium R229 TaxID=741978 RepID=G2ZVW4_9RALS|nr:hypothetical protein BDB_mp60411 [blood disease bacterium R229]
MLPAVHAPALGNCLHEAVTLVSHGYRYVSTAFHCPLHASLCGVEPEACLLSFRSPLS